MIRDELSYRLEQRPLQLTLKISETSSKHVQEVTSGYSPAGDQRLGLRAYGFRHGVGGMSIERNGDSSLQSEIIIHPTWSARYTHGSIESNTEFNSAMLIASDGSDASKDQVSDRLRSVNHFGYDLRLLGLSIRPPTAAVTMNDWRPIETEKSIQLWYKDAMDVVIEHEADNELRFAFNGLSKSGRKLPSAVVFHRVGGRFRFVSLSISPVGPQGSLRSYRVENSFSHSVPEGTDRVFPSSSLIESSKDEKVILSTEVQFVDEQLDYSFPEGHFTLASLGIPDGCYLRVFGSPLPDFLRKVAPEQWNAEIQRRDFRMFGGAPVPEVVQSLEEIRSAEPIADGGGQGSWRLALILALNAMVLFVIGICLLLRARRRRSESAGNGV